MKRPARVAIVGRPNVGKSTLFNRITGKRRALVHADPGVTRDVQRLDTDWAGVSFELIDTGGLFSGIEDSLIHQVEDRAIDEALKADAMIFVTDGEAGVTGSDVDVAARLREVSAPVFLAVNKSEKADSRHAAAEFYRLGFENLYPISALHGEGIGDLLDAVVVQLPRRAGPARAGETRLAVVGRPNVGKSSLINALMGKEMHIVDSRPGTTRDSVDLDVRWHGEVLTLIDTAGIKRRSRTRDGLTALTALKSIDTIKRADIAIMVLDASEDIAQQDVRVASYAHRAGKGLLFCVNKWDLIPEKTNATPIEFEKKIRRSFRFAPYAPILFLSALTGQRINRVLELAWKIKASRETRLPTAEVNRFIEEITAQNPPPAHAGGTGRVYYMTQVESAPPTFSCFVNKRAFFARSYLRFLNNRLRRLYPFEGTVIRIKLVEKNPKGERR